MNKYLESVYIYCKLNLWLSEIHGIDSKICFVENLAPFIEGKFKKSNSWKLKKLNYKSFVKYFVKLDLNSSFEIGCWPQSGQNHQNAYGFKFTSQFFLSITDFSQSFIFIEWWQTLVIHVFTMNLNILSTRTSIESHFESNKSI